MQHSPRAPLSYTYCYAESGCAWPFLPLRADECMHAVAFIATEIHRSLAALRAHNPSCEKRHPARHVCVHDFVWRERERTHTAHQLSASVLTRGARDAEIIYSPRRRRPAHVICMEQIARPLSQLASLKGENEVCFCRGVVVLMYWRTPTSSYAEEGFDFSTR